MSTAMFYAQKKIIKKDGNQIDAKIKSNDNLDGPMPSLEKKEIYQIIYNNGKTETLGEFSNAEEAKNCIVSMINEFGIDRNSNSQKLTAEFDGNNLKINSVNKKGKIVNDGGIWDLGNVIKFQELSARKDGYYINFVTQRLKNLLADYV